jgi:hypothetical protein
MQDRYACDIGDYGKYALLRQLCQGFRLGIAWYRVPNEAHNNDGRHTAYLQQPQAHNHDPELHNALAKIVQGGRTIERIEQSGVLPSGTVYHHEPLTYTDIPIPDRPAHRQAWFNDCQQKLAATDIIFCDPDNGLECKTQRHELKGPKYVYLDDLAYLNQDKRSLIVYHHLGRIGTIQEQVASWSRRLSGTLGLTCYSLLYRKGSCRAYFVLATENHKAVLQDRIERLAKTWDWFELV